MNINTLYFERFGRTVSIVTPRNNAEAKHVVMELDNFCLFCPTDTDTYDDCAECSVLKFVELLESTLL